MNDDIVVVIIVSDKTKLNEIFYEDKGQFVISNGIPNYLNLNRFAIRYS